jgi:superfamily I DNA/RNA helicase
MNLTTEQWAVVNAPEHILKVNAVAGSGKTTTLLEYARKRPNQRILYLSFNRSSSDEMNRKCFAAELKNIAVRTFHALAYKYANGFDYELVGDFSEGTILDNYVRGNIKEDKFERLLLISWLVKDMMIFYLNSSHIYIDNALLIHYKDETVPKFKIEQLLSCYDDFILTTVKSILTRMKKKEIPALHDFYLKMFHLSKPILSFYDVILIDEAQDLSGVMLDILNMQKASRVFVGDTFQQIYSFRYAINVLEKIDCTEYSLTQTFRFGHSFAQEVCKIVNRSYCILDKMNYHIKITGTEKETNIVNFSSYEGQKRAVISRSVLKLFSEAISCLPGKLSFYFEGGYDSYGFMSSRVRSVFYLYKENYNKIDDKFIKKFNSFKALIDFAKTSQNRHLLNSCELVLRYQEDLFDISKQIKQRIVPKEEAGIIFTTTHKAKGQEYPNVQMVEDDFITCEQLENAVKKPKEFNFQKLREEVNIFYVAATRAMDNIILQKF